jgi:hypothetical protein
MTNEIRMASATYHEIKLNGKKRKLAELLAVTSGEFQLIPMERLVEVKNPYEGFNIPQGASIIISWVETDRGPEWVITSIGC